MTSTVDFDVENSLYTYTGLNISHAITTRRSFDHADFNLSFHTGDFDRVASNRAVVKDHFLGAHAITIPKQCHDVKIHAVLSGDKSSIPEDVDALITNVKGQLIGVLSADCVPLLFHDPMKHVIGLAHAGWKGTVANIGPLTVEAMVKAYGCDRSNIHAYIGPSISQASFEVGDDVVTHFTRLELTSALMDVSGKVHADLWMANSTLLTRAGILRKHIQQAGLCTFNSVNEFYSARKEGFSTGRFGVFAML